MMFSYIIVSILILCPYVSECFECLNQVDNICCGSTCNTCGNCTGDIMFDKLCCGEKIINSGIYCSEANEPPCMLEINEFRSANTTENHQKKNDIDALIEWAKSLELYQLVLFLIAVGLVAFFIFYSCCIFGSKHPPVKYKYLNDHVL